MYLKAVAESELGRPVWLRLVPAGLRRAVRWRCEKRETQTAALTYPENQSSASSAPIGVAPAAGGIARRARYTKASCAASVNSAAALK